jgi:hypothetical protein
MLLALLLTPGWFESIPPAAEGFDQRDRRRKSLAAQAGDDALEFQRGVLRGRHLQISHEAGAVTVVGNCELPAGGRQRRKFLLVLAGQQPLGREVVLDIGKREVGDTAGWKPALRAPNTYRRPAGHFTQSWE